MNEPIWIGKRALFLLHAESLAAYGGLEGLRSDVLLESALARPRNIFAYEGDTNLARLAAAYAIGIAKNHPFADGNKRAAFLSIGVFLRLNGSRLIADETEAVRVMLAVAEGTLDEADLAEWIRSHIQAA